MKTSYLLIGVIIMALVTYLIRVTPMIVFKKKIENVRIKSFLYYVPYTVLAAMTFPAIFSSTQSEIASAIGCLVAIILAYFNKGLLAVALGASGAVLIAGMLGV